MQKKPWAKKEMRQQNVKKLRQALQSCGKGESESVEDFEQQILDKSRNMEEYLQNVAKVCCVFCVHNFHSLCIQLYNILMMIL